MHQTFIDLDELILLCRDKSSQKFIQEAVACYRAGAFRSCIVSTWNAVVFDFLHKLRELELFGDKKAPKLLQEFEQLRSAENFKDLWQFESNIPEKAHQEFELISPIEKLDIERLFQDRSRCAHPSMTSLEEPFEATAELARYHLRSAITHLLQRPPVQGRAASKRIFEDIKSEYFPVDQELAIKYFQASPLARARFTLIQDVVIGLTTSLLIENLPEVERERQFSALTAVSKMYVQETGKILNDKLSGIIINKVDDDNWDKVIIYLAKITVWESLSEPCQLKAQSFVEKLEIYNNNKYIPIAFSTSHRFLPDVKTLIKAAHIDFLRDYIIKKFDNIPVQDILSLNDTCGDNLFQTKIILPSLIKLAPEASLNDLFLIITKTSLVSDETILFCIKEKVKYSPLKDLADVMSNYDYELWQDLIRDLLEDKIINADFQELLSAKSKYNSSGKSKAEIIELFDNCINEKILEVDFDVLLKSSTYWSEIEEEKLILYLKNPLPEIVDFIELLLAKSKYKLSGKSKPEIIELLDIRMNEILVGVPFNDLLEYSEYWGEISKEIFILYLKDNLPKRVDLDQLVRAKLKYQYNSSRNSAPEIIEVFDNCIANKIEEMPFSDLLKFLVSNQEVMINTSASIISVPKIPEKLLIPTLKKNVQAIVTAFAQSSSFADASKRSELLIMIAEELNEHQWKFILKAFFDNDQIYYSRGCLADFRKLFEKSLELNNKSVQPYWLPFREKLNQLNLSQKEIILIDNLKQLIDSNLTPEQKNQLNN
ncbi:MAG: hypothetical protein F6K39_32070 [Okeania sp. SIO3B3]|nr:hypothetical protein [Okeania sp. SIO3B3]